MQSEKFSQVPEKVTETLKSLCGLMKKKKGISKMSSKLVERVQSLIYKTYIYQVFGN